MSRKLKKDSVIQKGKSYKCMGFSYKCMDFSHNGTPCWIGLITGIIGLTAMMVFMSDYKISVGP
jgi:hypothetical protein